ncbi:MAG: N-acetylmuramoyl-L-alanine amidase [Verrucomicrobiota bacterium]|nr:N-acetylmuramoyl-L-alanine amidase [Verrucomicrobiota bacterium]
MNIPRPFRHFVLIAFSSVTSIALAQGRGTIVLDAGHGGFDRGGVPGQRISEKDKTLDVAQRLRAILQKDGTRVIMTRDSDVFVPLPTRVAIANSYRGATFVSIHFNCAPRSGANGIETYYYRSDSAGLATRIHRNVVAGAPTENRGIRRRGFFVLRKTAIPSVLVECGFLTNPYEGHLATTSQYRQQLAEEIAAGIRGGPLPAAKPLARGSAASSEVLPQPFNGEDFVRAAPRSARAHSSRSGRSTRHHTSSKKQKSSRTAKKKARKTED